MSGFRSIQTEDFPNPDVYLNHLPPSEAQQFEISRNIAVAILRAAIWDILFCIPDDIKIISRSGGLSLICTLIMHVKHRISAVIYVILVSVERTAPINNAYIFDLTCKCFLALSEISSSYLFLKRAQAIYADHKWARNCFFISWLLVVGSGCIALTGVHPSYIPGTYYKDSGLAAYVTVIPWVYLLFDSIVFIAISYKVAKGHGVIINYAGEHQVGCIGFLSGRRLPQLSKAVLRGGEQYYFITVGTIILSAVVLSLQSNLQVVAVACPNMMVPLAASMACRVYRNLKLYKSDIQTLDDPIA